MGLQDIIAVGVAGVAAFYVVRMLRRSMRGESGCGCSSGSCGSNESGADDRRMPKRIPFVPADQLKAPGSAVRKSDGA